MTKVEDIKLQVTEILQEIPTSGSFSTSFECDFIFPEMKVVGLGELSYPINEIQAKALIQHAQKAPFGKGLETVYDNSVRSAWEIDATKIEFNGVAWEKFITKAIHILKPELGIESYEVSAHLYKLLIYEKGDFFLPHKDTEKESGMFGTLLVGLPSKHTGGELLVRFEGKENTVDFSDATARNKIPVAAFYADCEHEIKPLTDGYRICLVYNLVQTKRSDDFIQHNSLSPLIAKFSNFLSNNEGSELFSPGIILLGHQYTPENFSKENLKLDDRTKAEVILQACEKSGYYTNLCLVTSYLCGSPKFDGNIRYYRNDWDDDEDYENLVSSESEMDEVHDQWLDISNAISLDGIPPIREIEVDENLLISSFKINDGDPILQEDTGYMGNYGPDLTHWYHYGAIVFWHEKQHADFLLSQGIKNQLEWLTYYNQKRLTLTHEEIYICESIIQSVSLLPISDFDKGLDYTAVIDWYIGYKSESCFTDLGTNPLINLFTRIPTESWVKLVSVYPCKSIQLIYTHIGNFGDLKQISHLLSILTLLSKAISPKEFNLNEQITRFTVYFSQLIKNSKSPIFTFDSFQNLLKLEHLFPQNQHWNQEMKNLIVQNESRDFINNILILNLLNLESTTDFSKSIFDFCESHLKSRVLNKPLPPKDWSREIPNDTPSKKYWDILANFLVSPTAEVFEFRKNQAERDLLASVIKSVEIDLKMETIKKGSPHTLLIIKTQANYLKLFKAWKVDEDLLSSLLKKRMLNKF